jgi:hypothetical protein
MTFSKSVRLGASLGLVVLLIGCESYTQTTSGSAYLERYAEQAAAAGTGAMDAEIREAADVEPILTFPARVGIARIDDGRLSPIPQAEGKAWLAMADKLGAGWGEFLPVSPLIAALAAKPRSGGSDGAWQCRVRGDCLDMINRTVQDIRTAAARQHTDVVLIYEVVGKSRSNSNPLAIADLALIPMWVLPSRNVAADGYAQAVLLDVRNGYTYGFASAVAEDAAFTLSTLIDSSEASYEVADKAKTAAAIELTKEVADMARNLRLELAEKRAAEARVPAAPD